MALDSILQAVSTALPVIAKPLENIGAVSRINAENSGDIVQQALILKQQEQTKMMLLIGGAVLIIIIIIVLVFVFKKNK